MTSWAGPRSSCTPRRRSRPWPSRLRSRLPRALPGWSSARSPTPASWTCRRWRPCAMPPSAPRAPPCAASLSPAPARRARTLAHDRALDAVPSGEARPEAVRTLLGLGFPRVLSSGGAARALDGAGDLAAMVEAAEDLLDVCAGGGVRPADVRDLVTSTGLSDIHLSARRRPGAPLEADAPDTRTDPAIVTAAVDAAGEL